MINTYRVLYLHDFYDQPTIGIVQSPKGLLYFQIRFDEIADEYDDRGPYDVYLLDGKVANLGVLELLEDVWVLTAKAEPIFTQIKEAVVQGNLPKTKARFEWENRSNTHGVQGDWHAQVIFDGL